MRCIFLIALLSLTVSAAGKEQTKKSIAVVDPGEEGKKTLAGIDRDLNGVRDDIQVILNAKFPLDKYPSINQGMMELSKTSQLLLINHADKEKVLELSAEYLRALECLFWVTNVDVAGALDRLNRALLINTSKRVEAQIKLEINQSGLSTPKDILYSKPNEEYKFCKFEAKKEQIDDLIKGIK